MAAPRELAARFDDRGRFYLRSGLTPSDQVAGDEAPTALVAASPSTSAQVSWVFALSAVVFVAFAPGWRKRLVHCLVVAIGLSPAARNPVLFDADSVALTSLISVAAFGVGVGAWAV